jgi:septum formation protein
VSEQPLGIDLTLRAVRRMIAQSIVRLLSVDGGGLMTGCAVKRRPIILASQSPRRRELLTQIGLEFSIQPANVDERIIPGEQPEDHVLRLAKEKAMTAAVCSGQGIVIAADTVVVVDDSVLGKPADRNDAIRMLTLLSGTVHQVVTGLCVFDADSRNTIVRTSTTKVWFRTLATHEINAYVDSGEPLDKAGAYGIQGKGALLIDRIEGCYFNVVGLPLAVLGECLALVHVPLW